MVASAFLHYFGGRVGETIINEYTVCIVWKGLICVANALGVIERQLIAWIGRNYLLFTSAGTVRRCGMDFVADQLFDGQKIRALTVVDNYSRQCVAIHVGLSLKGEDVVAVMNYLKIVH